MKLSLSNMLLALSNLACAEEKAPEPTPAAAAEPTLEPKFAPKQP